MPPYDDAEEDFLVRVGTVVLAARVHYDDDQPERHRLALVLLDSAAELLLRRSTDSRALWFRLGELMTEQNQHAVELDATPPHSVHLMTFPSTAISESTHGEPVFLSRRQRQKLDREYGPNVDVSLFFGELSPSQAKALKHLHEYRNGAYHRNVINLRTVKILVQLQIEIVASLLRSCTGGVSRIYPAPDLAAVRSTLRLSSDETPSFGGVADILQRGIAPQARDVAMTLGTNIRDRVVQAKRRVNAIKDDLLVPGVEFEDWVALIQTPQPWPVSPAIRSLTPPVTVERLDEWQAGLPALAGDETALDVFNSFVDMDVPLMEFEDAVDSVELQVDQVVQQSIDEQRGR